MKEFNAKALAIAAVLYFAIFLFARKPEQARPEQMFRGVQDLSATIPASNRHDLGTTAVYAPQGKTVDTITPDRFVAPLAVVRTRTSSVTMQELGEYEQQYGSIPPGSVVVFEQANGHDASVDAELIHFLAEARKVYGVAFDPDTNGAAAQTALGSGLYVVAHLHNAETLPANGSIV
ncbi:MAG TPA: cyclase family protein, partial [Terriglobales bacterium]